MSLKGPSAKQSRLIFEDILNVAINLLGLLGRKWIGLDFRSEIQARKVRTTAKEGEQSTCPIHIRTL